MIYALYYSRKRKARDHVKRLSEYNVPNPEKETLNDWNVLKGQRPGTRL